MKHSQKKKGIFMMTETEKLKQLERLQRVPPEEWREVRKALVRRMTERLWAKVEPDERGVPRLVGGKTQQGAHSEFVLKGNALDVYMQRTFDALYFKWKWPENRSIEEHKNRFYMAHILFVIFFKEFD